MLKLDLLVIAVHPDDAELGAGGVMAKYVAEGKKVGIVDLTQGELGTRGTAETRFQEAKDAAEILGLTVRENLGLRDGFFENAEMEKMAVIKAIRKYQPEIVITNAITDRHPDHGRAGQMVNEACFLAGLRKVETFGPDNVPQDAYRPRLVLQFVQDYYIKPDEPQTYISNPDFMQSTAARAREFGRYIQAKYAEGFTSKKILGVDDLFQLK